ncbi:MAG: class I SAM-dependent methyltransferase [Gaiellaceae bacterium MAG52_C11]|nr:class I SAM-dependent methyltransferase [Candidatus Gaiellasilicea maunaloa]
MLPPLVLRAEALAAERGFARSCTREVGRLLHLLAASRGRERVAELGTGYGVGSAWIVSALRPQTPFFTAELDPELGAAASELFRDDPNVHVLVGDWRDTLPLEAPFDLLFFDAAKQEPENAELALGLLAPGGIALLDDLTPGRTGSDPVREFWLADERVAAVELLTAPSEAAILAVRL